MSDNETKGWAGTYLTPEEAKEFHKTLHHELPDLHRGGDRRPRPGVEVAPLALSQADRDP